MAGIIICGKGHKMARHPIPEDLRLACGCIAEEASDEVLAFNGVTKERIEEYKNKE